MTTRERTSFVIKFKDPVSGELSFVRVIPRSDTDARYAKVEREKAVHFQAGAKRVIPTDWAIEQIGNLVNLAPLQHSTRVNSIKKTVRRATKSSSVSHSLAKDWAAVGGDMIRAAERVVGRKAGKADEAN